MKEKIISITHLVKICLTIWGYITAIIFSFNGITLLLDHNYLAGGITLSISLFYCILISIVLKLGLIVKKTEREKQKLRLTRLLSKIFKLFIAVLTLIFTVGSLSSIALNKTINIAWIVLTILLDLLYYSLSFVINKLIKDFK